jgi:murein endopeptidase
VTYNPARSRRPNSTSRLWGTDLAVRRTLCVIDDYRTTHPDWPRIVVGDLSRPKGGLFGPEFGGLGHVSHQNGLDVDVYLPRWDNREMPPTSAGDVQLERAQELVNRFVAAGAQVIYVGPNTGLVNPGRRRVVRVLRNHDDHLHVRFRTPARTPGG